MAGNNLRQTPQNPELLHSKEKDKNWNNPAERAQAKTERNNTGKHGTRAVTLKSQKRDSDGRRTWWQQL